MVKSAKGREIDMEALRESNSQAVALGNAKMNARGDLLGKGGKILKTREQLAREYHDKAGTGTVKNVPVTKVSKEEPAKKSQSQTNPKVKNVKIQKTSVKKTETKKEEQSEKNENSQVKEEADNSDKNLD